MGLACLFVVGVSAGADWNVEGVGPLRGSFVRISDEGLVVVQRGNQISQIPLGALTEDSRQAALALSVKDEMRVWSDGSKTIRARYLGYKDGKVSLRFAGKRVATAYDKLVDRDKAFVRSQLAAAGKLDRLPPEEKLLPRLSGEEDKYSWRDWQVFAQERSRSWTDQNNQQAIGRLVGTDGDYVAIALGGRPVFMALSELSAQDHQYVDQASSKLAQAKLAAEQEAAEAAQRRKQRAQEREREREQQLEFARQQEQHRREIRQRRIEEEERAAQAQSRTLERKQQNEQRRLAQGPEIQRSRQRPEQLDRVRRRQQAAKAGVLVGGFIGVLFWVSVLGHFVCAFVLCIEIVRKGNPIVGVILMFLFCSVLFSIALFVIGWINAAKHDIGKLMAVWSCFVAIIVGCIAFSAIFASMAS